MGSSSHGLLPPHTGQNPSQMPVGVRSVRGRAARLGEQVDCRSDESGRRHRRMVTRPRSELRGGGGRCHTEARVCACVCLLFVSVSSACSRACALKPREICGCQESGDCAHTAFIDKGGQRTVLTPPNLPGQGGPHPYSESAWAFFPDLTLPSE